MILGEQRGLGDPPSRLRLVGVPVGSVMLASMLPMMLPVIANSPILPPLGLLMFLAWRLLRAEMWPIWIGVPLGLFDDLFSGQPIGSAMGLWSLVMLAIDQIDRRIYWRDLYQDWAIASIAIVLVIGVGALFALPPGMDHRLWAAVGPQMIFTCLAFPLVMRLCARLDRWRLGYRKAR